jgi:hypothetical protein
MNSVNPSSKPNLMGSPETAPVVPVVSVPAVVVGPAVVSVPPAVVAVVSVGSSPQATRATDTPTINASSSSSSNLLFTFSPFIT